MGNAFHKKKIPLGRGSKTRGVGIGYVETSRPQGGELTAEEIAEREKTAPARGVREWNVHRLMKIAGFALDAWEDAIFVERGIVIDDFTRDLALEKITDKAYTIANTAITKACGSDGVDVDRLIGTLNKRSEKAKFYNERLASAISHISKKFSSLFASATESGRESLAGQKDGL
jgi:hypothetical protein